MKREGDVVIVDAPGGMKIKMKLEGRVLRIKEYANGTERAKYEIRLNSDEYENVKNILKNAKTDQEVLQIFAGVMR
ncbi:hypothetical protein LS215_1558 [Sulfolobus islandicus L.S.2.15]|uniref:Uncharacterized protein n=1 Tax=Saccharolobus islandicus (strain L.S.2.15 / Lassen \|nr:hypothetical protein [Sulfolobus islandicus]ACP35566.1 hypothetical protein LS215_1558 [Sulfolobus islandicus L.S.2.15]